MRADSTESAPEIDLPLHDRVPEQDVPPAVQYISSSWGPGVAIGMLVIGLLAGFVGGFIVAQRMTPPSPPPVVQVPRPADSTVPTTVAPAVEPPVGTSANQEPPTVIEEPSVQQPLERAR